MINIDIAVVTYNSEKWIDGFLTALFQSEGFDKSRIHIFFKDNGSTDNTVQKLKSHKLSGEFGTYKVLEGTDNSGFGTGSNAAAKAGKSPYILFVNIDTEITPDSLAKLEKTIEESSELTGGWEMRQFPYEHPKIYNPVTMETSWCSGACFLIRRDIFNLTGGFDESIFMYGEDVDLSWRIRSLGYNLIYVPESCIYHYSYSSENEFKPTQYFGSIKANIMLRWRYGKLIHIAQGYINLLKCFIRPVVAPDAKRKIKNIIVESLKNGSKFKKKYKYVSKKVAKFLEFDYEYTRYGAFYKSKIYSKENTPLVSVIVRTCGRPQVLYECLKSIQNQTYKNIEVCIVEDGKNISEEFIKREFPKLNIKYKATEIKKGRSYAGNLALSMASGEYFNFLDDDDVFYSDHIETMVNAALDNPEGMLFYAKAFETPIVIESKEPYKYKLKDFVNIPKPSYSKTNLVTSNLFPIQTVFFKKSVYEKFGGFDTSYEYLEDWELWLRYSTLYDYIAVNKLTSEYRIPAKSQNAKTRTELLKMNEDEIRNKYMQMQNILNLNGIPFNNSTNLYYNIDYLKMHSSAVLQVVGWGFITNHQKQNKNMYVCITDNEKNKYFFETDRYYRPDVTEVYPETKEKLCGITAYIPIKAYNIKKVKQVEFICACGNKLYANKNRVYNYYSSKTISYIMRKLKSLKEILYKKEYVPEPSQKQINNSAQKYLLTKRIPSLKPVFSKRMKCNIEKFQKYRNISLSVSGWCLMNNIKSELVHPLLKITDNRNKTHYIMLEKVKRNDVARYFDDNKYFMSGFLANIDLSLYKISGIKKAEILAIYKNKLYICSNSKFSCYRSFINIGLKFLQIFKK